MRLFSPASTLRKNAPPNHPAVPGVMPPEVAVSIQLQRLRSAAGGRGVRLIVAGLNGGQSRVVAVTPRTITFRLGEFLAWLAPPLRTSGFNRWSWLSCAQLTATRTRRQRFSAVFWHTWVLIPSGEVNTVDGGELKAASLRANHGRFSRTDRETLAFAPRRWQVGERDRIGESCLGEGLATGDRACS